MLYHPCLSCTRPARTRGLCLTHYRRLAYRVAGGMVTWEQLQAAGQCLPARPSPWRDGLRWLRRK